MAQEDQSVQFSAYITDILTKKLFTRVNAPISMLDFGCGEGLIAHFMQRSFPNAHLIALDNDKILIENNIKNYPELSFIYTQGVPLPFSSNFFDLIYMVNVIHHIPSHDHSALFNELLRILNDSGSLIIFEYNPFNPSARQRFRQDHRSSKLPMIWPSSIKSLCKNLNVTVQTQYLYPNLEQKFFYHEPLFSKVPFGSLYAVTIQKA